MSNPVPLELQAKIANWRLRAAAGELTFDEMKEAIIYLRAGRVAAAAQTTAAKVKKAKAVIPSADEMLDDLDNM